MLSETKIVSVVAISQFGIKDKDKWYNFDKDNSNLKSSLFKKGFTYELETEEGQRGTIIKSIKSTIGESKNENNKTVTQVNDERQERILRQGIYQSWITSPALATFVSTKDNLLNTINDLAEKTIEIVRKTK